MSLATNIVRRGGTYYIRVAVPKAVQAVIGRREIWKSLGTSEAPKARALAPRVLDKLQSAWGALAQQQPLTPADIEEAVWERYSRLVELDERFRSDLPTDEELDQIWQHLEKELGEFDIGAFRISLKARHFEDGLAEWVKIRNDGPWRQANNVNYNAIRVAVSKPVAGAIQKGVLR